MEKIIVAGFGGQGVLSFGQLLAYAALDENKAATWLPSYGPEMRGGTANCSVIISDTPIGSPIISVPNVVIAMNRPSLDKYINVAESGAYIFYDSSLIDEQIERKDVKAFPIPATQMASDNGLTGLANMIMLGKMVKESGAVSYDLIMEGLKKVVSAKHADKLEKNIKALDLGYNF